VKFVTRDWK